MVYLLSYTAQLNSAGIRETNYVTPPTPSKADVLPKSKQPDCKADGFGGTTSCLFDISAQGVEITAHNFHVVLT